MFGSRFSGTCTLAVSATGNPSPNVIGRLDYDSDSLPGAQVSYEISLPHDHPPGWGEISRTLDGQRFMHFDIQAPFPPQPGAHWSQRLFHGPNQPPQSVPMSVSERTGLCR